MSFPIDPDLYRRHKDKVLGLTNARQRYEVGKDRRALTDAEIAARLGVTVEEATEIRCIAELEVAGTEEFFSADSWKQARFERASKG